MVLSQHEAVENPASSNSLQILRTADRSSKLFLNIPFQPSLSKLSFTSFLWIKLFHGSNYRSRLEALLFGKHQIKMYTIFVLRNNNIASYCNILSESSDILFQHRRKRYYQVLIPEICQGPMELLWQSFSMSAVWKFTLLRDAYYPFLSHHKLFFQSRRFYSFSISEDFPNAKTNSNKLLVTQRP